MWNIRYLEERYGTVITLMDPLDKKYYPGNIRATGRHFSH